MERPGVLPVKALASVAKGLSDKKEDLPPLPKPTLRQRFSDVGRAWTETISAPARSGESTIYSEKGPEAVAQAAQVKGLPDMDHARYFLAVSEEVSAAIIKKAVGRGVRDLERPLVQTTRGPEALPEKSFQCETMSAAADAPRVDDGPINVDALRIIRQRKRYF